MSKTIEVAVPDEIFVKLAERAGDAGVSLPELIAKELERVAAEPLQSGQWSHSEAVHWINDRAPADFEQRTDNVYHPEEEPSLTYDELIGELRQLKPWTFGGRTAADLVRDSREERDQQLDDAVRRR